MTMAGYPGFGAACNGCGLCCLHAPCPLSKKYGLWSVSGCRALKRGEARYWCEALAHPAAFKITETGHALEMLIGGALGCSFRAAWSIDGVRNVLKKAPVTGYFQRPDGTVRMRRLRGNSHSKAQWPRAAVLYQPNGHAVTVTQSSASAEPTAGETPLSQFTLRQPIEVPPLLVGLAAVVVTLLVGCALLAS